MNTAGDEVAINCYMQRYWSVFCVRVVLTIGLWVQSNSRRMFNLPDKIGVPL